MSYWWQDTRKFHEYKRYWSSENSDICFSPDKRGKVQRLGKVNKQANHAS